MCPIHSLSELLFLSRDVILLFKNGFYDCTGKTITVFHPYGFDFLYMNCHSLGLICPENLDAHPGFCRTNQAISRCNVCFQLSDMCFYCYSLILNSNRIQSGLGGYLRLLVT